MLLFSYHERGIVRVFSDVDQLSHPSSQLLPLNNIWRRSVVSGVDVEIGVCRVGRENDLERCVALAQECELPV